MSTPRETMRALLEDGPDGSGRLLPKEWSVIYSERSADQHGTQLRLQQQTVQRHPQAGTGVHLIGFKATVTVDGTDLDKAENRLDDELTELVMALDSVGIRWDEWTKAVYDGSLGYQSTVYLTASKEL